MHTCGSGCRSGDRRDRIVMSRRSPLLLLILLATGAPASAGDELYGIEITPFAGYVLGGSFESDSAEGNDASSDIDIDDAASYGLIVNWPSDANTEWEIYLSRQSTSLENTDLFAPDGESLADLDITFLQAGGTYYFDGARARPYIVATIGASRFEPDDSAYDSETFFAFGFGGGVKLAPSSRLGLRLEGRVLGSVLDSDSAVFCRSGPSANACLVAVSGSLVWQWEVLAGLIFRL